MQKGCPVNPPQPMLALEGLLFLFLPAPPFPGHEAEATSHTCDLLRREGFCLQGTLQGTKTLN